MYLRRGLLVMALVAGQVPGMAWAQQPTKPVAKKDAQPVKRGSKTLEAQKRGDGATNTPAKMAMDDSKLDEAADKSRDQQIAALKKIIPKVTAEQKADLLFQLAELWWEKSKY